ncbi:hypothetical protein D3C80_1015630 [compost metagenome]
MGRGGHVLVVVAWEQTQLTVVQVSHVRAHAVEEVTVVGNDDHGAVTRRENAFQPADSVDVQVVGRFVEQQHFRVGEQGLRQQYAQFPAWCYFGHRAEMLFQWNTQTQQQLTGTGFGGIAVHFSEFCFQLGHGHAVFFGHFWQRIDTVALSLDPPQFLVAHDHGVDHGKFFVGELVLAQFTQTHVRLEHDLACGRLQVAAEDFHEGRLAAAVGADQAVAVAVVELDRDVLEQGLGAELHGDVSGGDQRAYLSIAYVAGIAADTDLIPICSFSSSLQSELELIQRAYVDSSICTLWPSCWEINAGLRPDIKHIVA